MRKRICASLAGVILSGVSIAIFRSADLGSDPFTVLCTGIGCFMGKTYGEVFTILTGIGIVIALLLKRSLVGIATLLNICGVGLIGDSLYACLDIFKIAEQVLAIRLCFMAFGIILQCFAAALYYSADLGVSGYDAIAIICSDRMSVDFKKCRISTHVFCIIVGCVLGGTAGIGTILTAFCMGGFIQFFRKKIVDIWLSDKSESLKKNQ